MVTKERSLRFSGGGLTLEQKTKGQERLGTRKPPRSQETTAVRPPAVRIFVMFVAPLLSVLIIRWDNFGNWCSHFS